jgi:hypothetical protein
MTVAELQAQLARFDGNMYVGIGNENGAVAAARSVTTYQCWPAIFTKEYKDTPSDARATAVVIVMGA